MEAAASPQTGDVQGKALEGSHPAASTTSANRMDGMLPGKRRVGVKGFAASHGRGSPCGSLSEIERRPTNVTSRICLASCVPADAQISTSQGRAEQVRSFVEAYRKRHGRDPTFSDVRNDLKLPPSTASVYLRKALA